MVKTGQQVRLRLEIYDPRDVPLLAVHETIEVVIRVRLFHHVAKIFWYFFVLASRVIRNFRFFIEFWAV